VSRLASDPSVRNTLQVVPVVIYAIYVMICVMIYVMICLRLGDDYVLMDVKYVII
jgi:hypothetical protein